MSDENETPTSAAREISKKLSYWLTSLAHSDVGERIRNLPVEIVSNPLQMDVQRAAEIQRKMFFRRMFLFILLPTILSALYVFVYATPRYVSEFQIVYRSQSQESAPKIEGGHGIGLLSGIFGSSSQADMTRVISSYLVSKPVIEALDKSLNLRKQFSSDSIDWLDRLSENAPIESLQKYFKRRVSVYEENGGFLTVYVEGFSPEAAKTLAQALSDSADTMVSEMGARSNKDMVAFTEASMREAANTLASATRAITAFRDVHADYDLSQSVTQLSTVVGTLNAQISEARARLTSLKLFLGDNAPPVRVLASQIQAMEDQVKKEQKQLGEQGGKETPDASGKPTLQPYSKVMAEYKSLVQNEEFARQMYLSSKQAHEAARLAAARKEAYVVNFVPPNLPEKSTSPSGAHYITTTFLSCLILYSVISLLLGLVRDQAGM